MGNRITRTVLFAASAIISINALGAGAARFGTLRNSDWVVTNAWQAVSNKTHDLIIDMGQESSLPPNWSSVSNAAMSAVQTEVMTSFVGQSLRMFSQTNEVMSGGPYLSSTGGTIIAQLATPDAGLEVLTPGIPMLGSPPRATRMRAGGFGVSDLAGDWLWLDTLGFRFVTDGGEVRFNLPLNTTGGMLARLEDIDLVGARIAGDATNYTDRATNDITIIRTKYDVPSSGMYWLVDRSLELPAGSLAGRPFYLGPELDEAASLDDATNAAVAVADAKISTNNAAFVSAVLAAPLVGADPSDLSEIAEYGSYGTVGAALLALIAGLAALKRRMISAETEIGNKASSTDLPYALVTPGEWSFAPYPDGVTSVEFLGYSDSDGWGISVNDNAPSYTGLNDPNALELEWDVYDDGTCIITATRPSLPGHLLDRAVTGDVTLTLPAHQEGKVRDLLVHVDLGDDGTNPYTVKFVFPTGESNTGFKVKGNASAPIPAPDAAGEWLFSFSESSPHKMAVSLAQLQDATVAGGS